MEMLQTILVTVSLAAWFCLSVALLISAIQTFIYDRKREKREKEKAARDLEYHTQRMAELEK